VKILLTGATGFVGRQVLPHLLERGHEVRVVVRESTTRELTSASQRVERFEVNDLFTTERRQLGKMLSGIDVVIHAAWRVSSPDYLSSPDNFDCLYGSVRLGQAFTELGGRRFIGIGTCFEYDLTGGEISSETPLKPLTTYGVCKAATFHSLSLLFAANSTEFLWCRLFYLYGVGERSSRLVPYIRDRISAGQPALLGSGTQVRDYLDVQVAAKLIVEQALGAACGEKNICSGAPISVRELAERVADEYQRRDLLVFGAREDSPLDPPVVVCRAEPGRSS